MTIEDQRDGHVARKGNMLQRLLVVAGLLAASTNTQAASSSPDRALPLRSGRETVALVGDDPIFLDELVRERGPAQRGPLSQGRGNAEDFELLDRLITIRLIGQEAAVMGLDELPEITRQIEVTSREIMREVLMDRLVQKVLPDPEAVETLFRETVREWKTASLLFSDEAAARSARKEIAGGASFDEVAARVVKVKAAQAADDNEFHAAREFLPQIVEAITPLRPGQTSPVIRVPTGFALVRVVDIRYPPNTEARAQAWKQVLSKKQIAFLKAHEQVQRRRYVVVNQSILKSLNYEAPKPPMEELLQDLRVVAEIKGGDSVTVADLTDYLRMQFFHGSNDAARGKNMNARKEDALDATLGRRLLNMEARQLGIDRTPAYQDRIRGFKESLIFDNFVQKVIAPENKLQEQEARDYYNAHRAEYSYPSMLRVKSLAFERKAAAEDAMRKLKEGSDYGWLVANAEGQAPRGTPGVLALDGQPVTTESMPGGLRKVLAGARSGDFRMYESPDGRAYVIAVQQVVEPVSRPYEEVREDIARKIYSERIKKGVEDYAAKLRAQSKVEIYLERTQ